jgi:cell division protease FtsH
MHGGRAAEEIVYGTKTTGAENDIEQATQLARKMVTQWGMSENLGMVRLAPRENPYLRSFGGDSKPFSEETARAIDNEIRDIIGRCREQAMQLLKANRRELDALVKALLAHETLDTQQILEVTGLTPAPEPERAENPARQ